MNKNEAKKIAKDRILTALGCAYYNIADSRDFTDEEKELIYHYITKFGTTMAKSIKEEYITY